MARYAPGASAERPVVRSGAPGAAQTSNCGWDTTTCLTVSLSIFRALGGAQQEYALDVQAAHQNGNGTTFTGAQPVSGTGQQATAVFQTRTRDVRAVTLYVWPGNAEAQATFAIQAAGQQPRAVKLAAVTAVVRDVLAALLA